MITRIEVTNYRCFDKMGVNLEDFRVLVGANGSGKTTLMDIPPLLGDLLNQPSIGDAFLTPLQERGSRASTFTELIHQSRGTFFSFAVEAELPDHIIRRLLDDKTEVIRRDESQWPKYARYEVRLEVFNQRELQVESEFLFAFAEKNRPDVSKGEQAQRLYGDDPNRNWLVSVTRERGDAPLLRSDVKPYGQSKRSHRTVKIPSNRLALSILGLEQDDTYPVGSWMFELLSEGAVFFDPNWNELRKASQPGQSDQLIGSGANLPWLAMDLQKADPDRFADWFDHVRIALPQVTKLEAIEREEDHYAYFKLTYNDIYSVTSSGLSDGTLRILALTLLSHLPTPPRMLIVEEPENGIHPKAIEVVLQGLASMHESQVLVSTHSPVVVANVELEQLLAARVDRDGASVVVNGREHPRLVEWKDEVDLGTLFAAGVLG